MKGSGSGIGWPPLMLTTVLTGGGTLDKFLNVYVLQFPNFKNVADNTIASEGDCGD